MLHPIAARQLHPTRNGALDPCSLGPSANRVLWWRCEAGHEWQQKPRNRFEAIGRGVMCPMCWAAHGRGVDCERSLAALAPELTAQLDPDRNVDVDPWRVAPHSGSKLWWRCEHGHVWQATVSNRRRGTGCPYCSGRRSPINHTAFHRISSRTWYWLGFLAADGCVSDGGSVHLRLAARDLAHIKAFRAFVGGGERRISGPHKGSYCLTFQSKPIASDLERLGAITPRKTATYCPPARAAAQAAFWLGMLDGDGTVYWHRDARHSCAPRPELIWTGSEAAMAACSTFWSGALCEPRVAPPHRIGRALWEVRLSSAAAQPAASALLAASDFSLARKRAKLVDVAAYAPRPSAQITRSCGWCGGDVVRYRSAAQTPHTFCSREHYLAWRRAGSPQSSVQVAPTTKDAS